MHTGLASLGCNSVRSGQFESSRHHFLVSTSASASGWMAYACEGERGLVHAPGGPIRRYTGPPPSVWGGRLLAPPGDEQVSGRVQAALTLLREAWGNRLQFTYSAIQSRRRCVDGGVIGPDRTSSAWSVTGWLAVGPGRRRIPLGWSGRGDGLNWLEGRAGDELRFLAGAVNGATTMAPGRVHVVFAPAAAAVILHEAIGHLAEAPLIGSHGMGIPVGSRVANDVLTVTDDPLALHGPAHYEHDDENVGRLMPMCVVASGVLIAQLHSRATAAHAQTLPTGNGRAASAWDTPIPRVSNLICHPGPRTEQQLIGQVDHGLYVHRLANGMTNGRRIEADIVLAERIDGGARSGQMMTGGRLVEDIELSSRIAEVADNPAFHFNAMCGRAGQLLFDVGTSAPSLRVTSANLVV